MPGIIIPPGLGVPGGSGIRVVERTYIIKKKARKIKYYNYIIAEDPSINMAKAYAMARMKGTPPSISPFSRKIKDALTESLLDI